VIFEHRAFDHHERVSFVVDERAGLRAIIAIHSTVRGAAAGGCRMWDYASSRDALADVLRLSRGMSLKNAAADLPLGGGKAVIMRPKGSYDRHRLMQAFGDAVNAFGGSYWTAEDVGTSVDDMELIASRTAYVAGRSDPSPITALGVAVCIEAAINQLCGVTSLSGLQVAVQGLGNVGMGLCKLLHEGGARLIVADVDDRKTKAATEAFQASVVGVQEVHAAKCDVFAPCALGGILNAGTIPRIQARLICGAANNQLDTIDDAKRLQARGIAYAPDFITNAGGICSVASEILNINDPAWVKGKITTLGQTLRDVLAQSAVSGETTAVIAERMALDRIAAAAANLS
jgi:leucine dehydrogenase